MTRILSLISLLLMTGILFFTVGGLPLVGDPNSPASTHLSPHIIENAYNETGSPNLVTAVLADYRAYDTWGEAVVIFTAGLASVMILRATGNEMKAKGGKEDEK